MPKIQEPDFQEKSIWSEHVVAGSGSDTSAAIAVEGCESKTIYVKSDRNCIITVQLSPDGSDFYNLKGGTGVDTEDTDREWGCNSEAIAFQVVCFAPYMQIKVSNNDAEDAIISININ